MPTHDSTTIVPHLRESVFRTYEKDLTRAVNAWPEESYFTVPEGRSPHTHIAGFRSAVLSLKTYSWETSIDVPKFLSILGTFNFIFDPADIGKIWLKKRGVQGRPREMTKQQRPPSKEELFERSMSSSPSLSLVPIRDITEEELFAFCTLLHFGRIAGPIYVVGDVSSMIPEGFSEVRNVAVIFDPLTKQTILT